MSNCKEDLAILVVSCDRYADLWEIFFTLFDRYWPDCPYKVYLGTNFKTFELGGRNSGKAVETIFVGEDKNWADNARCMLGHINEPYVLMLLEDFFIDKPVDTDHIRKRLDYVIKNDLDCLRLNPCPPPCNVIDRKLRIGCVECGSPYYITTQPSIWKKESLSRLMRPGFSAWDFEIRNSKESESLKMDICGSNCYLISHRNGVERGRFYKSTLQFLLKENLEVHSTRAGNGVINDLGLVHRLKLIKYHSKEWIYIKLRLYRQK